MKKSKFSDFARYSVPADHLPRRMNETALLFLWNGNVEAQLVGAVAPQAILDGLRELTADRS